MTSYVWPGRQNELRARRVPGGVLAITTTERRGSPGRLVRLISSLRLSWTVGCYDDRLWAIPSTGICQMVGTDWLPAVLDPVAVSRETLLVSGPVPISTWVPYGAPVTAEDLCPGKPVSPHPSVVN